MQYVFVLFFFLSFSFVKAEKSYIAQSKEQYAEVLQGAFDCLALLSPKLAEQGRNVERIQDYYKRLHANNKGEIGSSQLQKAYLSFKKVVKACDLGQLDLIGPKETLKGRHDENSPLLGIKADRMQEYIRFVKENSEYLRFGNSLYHQNPNCPGEPGEANLTSTSMTMLPEEMKKKVDELSYNTFVGYLDNHKLRVEQSFQKSKFRAGVTLTYDTDNQWNNWSTHILVNPKGSHNQEFNAYVSPSIVALHELCHVEHTLPGEPDVKITQYHSSIHEVPCVIDQIILQDELYKEIKNIPLSEEVEYPNPTQANINFTLNPGKIANVFRKLKKEKQGDVLLALMSDQGQVFVRSHFTSSSSCKDLQRYKVLGSIDRQVSKVLQPSILRNH